MNFEEEIDLILGREKQRRIMLGLEPLIITNQQIKSIEVDPQTWKLKKVILK